MFCILTIICIFRAINHKLSEMKRKSFITPSVKRYTSVVLSSALCSGSAPSNSIAIDPTRNVESGLSKEMVNMYISTKADNWKE